MEHSDMSLYVHEYQGRWYIATPEFGNYGRYTAPLKTGGAYYGSAGYCFGDNAYSCARRRDAVRKAREIYDVVDLSDFIDVVDLSDFI